MKHSKLEIQNSPFPRYDRYKDSGVEWLGEVPEHWEVRSLRGILKERGETNEGTKTDFILSVMKDRGVIPYTEKGNVGNKMSEDITTYKIVHPGDLVINKMNAIIGSLGISEHHGALSKVYFVLQPRYEYLNNRFYGYLFRIRDFQKSLCKISYGIMELRESINFNEFKNLPLPLPPKPEQDRIVAFLDRKTAEIDTLIAKKQRQIELLDEQKAILINRAVTRGLSGVASAKTGLNPNASSEASAKGDAKLKPSGIEWIGDIPQHWEVLKLRRLLSNIEQGNSPNAVQENGDPEQWKVITLSAVSKGEFRKDAFKPISSSTVQKEANTLRPGDLLLTRANTRSLVGDACIVGQVLPNTTFSDLVYRFQTTVRISPNYLLRYLLANAARSQIERDARGSNETMCKVSHGHIKEWDITLPPMAEQSAIVARLVDLDRYHTSASASIKSQIHALQTLRSTLIAHAVTGSIKV